jgi:hypothetical protein
MVPRARARPVHNITVEASTQFVSFSLNLAAVRTAALVDTRVALFCRGRRRAGVCVTRA